MKKSKTLSYVLGLAALAATVVGYNASATLSIDLGTVTGGAFVAGDSSSSPYLHANIVNGTLGANSGVYVTMTAPGLGFAGSGS